LHHAPVLTPLEHAHPDLHSFPTRRSSDLTIANQPLSASGPPRACPNTSMIWRFSYWLLNRPRQTLLGRWRRLGMRLEEVSGRSSDRKSTRLNSSHDQISYAVFCLKKKIVY